MNRLAPVALGLAAIAGSSSVGADERCPPLVYWQPAAEGGPLLQAKTALERNIRARGGRFVDATDSTPRTSPSLKGHLEAAIDAYRAFRYQEAAQSLDDLDRQVAARGGGDLDPRQLSEVYLYRGLSRTELGRADAAWEDLVRAARLDPARALDPAQFPPRAAAAFGRAVTNAVGLARVGVELVLPPDARLRIDGRDVSPPLTMPLGPHLVRVTAEGYAPWSGLVVVTTPKQRLEVPLDPVRPPPMGHLEHLCEPVAGRVLTAAVERHADGWRLTVRLRALDGHAQAEEERLDHGTIARVADELLHRLLDAREQGPSRRLVPWWAFTIAGGLAATLAVIVPIAVVYGPQSPTGTIGGPIAPLR